MQTKQEQLFRDAGVWKAIANLAVPAMISMVVMLLYNMADMFFVGQAGNTAQVAAVSIAGPVFTLIMAVGNMLGGGGCVLIAKTLGEKDGDRVKLYSSLCCWGSLLFGIVFAALAVVFADPLLGFLGANEETWQYAKMYLTVLALGAPIMIFTTGFGGIIRAEGAIREGMIANLLSTVTNIILDPVFILVFHLGVGGAAIATVLGNAVGAVYIIFYVKTKEKKNETNFTLSPSYARRNPWEIRRVLAIGAPNAINSVLVGFASAIANQLLAQYGTTAVAAMAAAGKSTMVISMIQMGICMGVQPLLAYCYGERNVKRIRETLVKLSILTVGIGLTVTVLCLFNSRILISLFLKEPEALALGREMISMLVLSGPFLGVYYLGSNFLQASGNAPMATLVSTLRQGIFLIPLLYIMNGLFGVKGNILAHIIADITAAAVAAVLALRQYRKLAKNKILC
ncbi:MATE efflux family protein [Marvinbryantia formatexigens DSM 14469]|uniref:Multidrug export protein MepA n=1 Tax=Marvinbryantia formatexigens DSM 14469 TaxID=478749 RepID=C6LBV4_9FIRM|nr:MATE family efflux transporter [Marvinbryantia formatexigens]EET61907.1 MATE efflux family protein [Marvinbryantia formatexigens DSM 14469]UWO25748.1 MATE family efflux transporter [Marvinbryantia formatexigens DSM 14469]SDF35504.1 putative efflux protein, MATE family [Marvinbryantia formatexigens]